MTRVFLSAAFAALFFAYPAIAAAQITIIPQLIDSSEPVMAALANNAGHASTTLTGRGRTLRLVYDSPETLEVYMVSVDKNGAFVPTDFMRFMLPAGKQAQALIDLSVSPGWSFGERKYLLHLLSPSADANASFYQADFLAPGVLSMLTVPAKHFLKPEPYTPGTFHALFGYRVLGLPVTVMAGFLAVIIVLLMFVTAGAKSAVATLSILIIAQLLYGLRFSADLLRFTREHLTSYYTEGIYDEAGSMHAVAALLREKTAARPETSVYFCRDGTNFKEKLLRYFVYPLPVSAESDAAKRSMRVVVSGKYKEGYTYEKNMLRCGEIDSFATLLGKFPDGTEIFSLTPRR